jgi:hypothetical protein
MAPVTRWAVACCELLHPSRHRRCKAAPGPPTDLLHSDEWPIAAPSFCTLRDFEHGAPRNRIENLSGYVARFFGTTVPMLWVVKELSSHLQAPVGYSIVAQREMLRFAQGELTVSRLEIERYKLMLAKARREQ